MKNLLLAIQEEKKTLLQHIQVATERLSELTEKETLLLLGTYKTKKIVLKFGDDGKTISYKNEQFHFTKKEFLFIKTLYLSRRGRANFDTIETAVWGNAVTTQTRNKFFIRLVQKVKKINFPVRFSTWKNEKFDEIQGYKVSGKNKN